MSGRKLAEAAAKIDRTRLYHPAEALELARETNPTKFDATVEVAFRLGVDPRRADQMVRGTVSLPNGTGKTVRVAVFAEGEAARLAEEAGADVVGGRDLVERVGSGLAPVAVGPALTCAVAAGSCVPSSSSAASSLATQP